MPKLPSYIFGLHDTGGENLMLDAGKPGWIVVAVKANEGGGDFSGLANAGLGVIVRLNNGYGSEGTIPPASQYDGFAQDCGNYVANSRGANIWIIGNETNLAGERPGNSGGNDGEVITPDKYAQCFAKCRAAIRNVPGHADDWIAPAPPGPWNPQTTYPGNPAGDWVKYYQDILNQCLKLGAPPTALAMHTYSHGSGADTVGSEQKLGAPFQNYHFHFRAYRDFLSVVPPSLRALPVLITETQPADPDWWQNRDTGWIQAAYAEINQWNATPGNQPILALCLFRWQKGEPNWSISDKGALQNAFRSVMQNAYRVPALAPQPTPTSSPLPPRDGGGGGGGGAKPAQPQTPAQPATPALTPTSSGWYPYAVKRPITPNNYDVGRSGQKVTAVVLHIAAGPMSAVFPTFNDPKGLASAHFCVGKDGRIEQYVSIEDTAYGVGMRYTGGQWCNPRGIGCTPSWQGLRPPYNPNLYTISIEHEGQPEDQWTLAMYDANNRLLQWIAAQCNLTYVPHQTLIGHYEIDPVDRPNCPGPNVDWNRIAADANAGAVPPDQLTAVQNAANEVTWLPINTASALFQFAQARNLGCPQTDEFQFKAGNEAYIGQVFNQGITYVKQGDWGNVQSTGKPENSPVPTDPVALAAVTAAQQIKWMPINTSSALFRYASANSLGCPQTDEFEFNAGDDYVGQVYVRGFVFVKKGDWGNIRWVAKPQ